MITRHNIRLMTRRSAWHGKGGHIDETQNFVRPRLPPLLGRAKRLGRAGPNQSLRRALGKNFQSPKRKPLC